MKKPNKILTAFLTVMLLAMLFSTNAAAESCTTILTATVPCTVPLQIGEHGTVTVNGITYTGDASIKADLDTVLTYTITPDSGYEISKVTYDGTDVTASAKSGTYTALALKGNVTLTVAFTKAVPTSPQTGDESCMALWIAMMCVSGAEIAALVISSRKRKART